MDDPAQQALDGALETALLVTLPEVADVVDRYRLQLDLAAGWGVPPHLTVTYPFLAPREVDDAVLAGLGELFAAHPAFDSALARTAWFGEEVLYLAPDPDAPFRELTAAVQGAFPDHPPYRGAHGEPHPHLSIGQRRLGDLAGLRSAEEALTARLPLPVHVASVQLWAGSREPGSWRQVADLPLGPPG